MQFELINGSWVQTFTSILYDIDQKLSDTEIDDIIRKIDENFENDINSLKVDSNVVKYNLMRVIDEVNNIKYSNGIISENVDKILDRVNALSIVKEIRHNGCKPKVEEKKVHYRKDPCRLPHRPLPKPIEKECDKVYVIDMFLRAGYSEQYKIYIEGGYTYDWRLSWLISGNKRRLLHMGELTDDLIKIYNSYGIYDIDIINKSRLSEYKKNK